MWVGALTALTWAALHILCLAIALAEGLTASVQWGRDPCVACVRWGVALGDIFGHRRCTFASAQHSALCSWFFVHQLCNYMHLIANLHDAQGQPLTTRAGVCAVAEAGLLCIGVALLAVYQGAEGWCVPASAQCLYCVGSVWTSV